MTSHAVDNNRWTDISQKVKIKVEPIVTLLTDCAVVANKCFLLHPARNTMQKTKHAWELVKNEKNIRYEGQTGSFKRVFKEGT